MIPHYSSARDPAVPHLEKSLAGLERPIPSIWHSLTHPSSNPLLSTGLSLLIFGSLLSIGRKGFTQGALLVQRRMLVSLEIPSRDRSHAWLLAWMEEHSMRAPRERLDSPPQSSRSELWKDALELFGLYSGPPRPVKIISRDLAAITSTPTAPEKLYAELEAHAFNSGGPLPSKGSHKKPSKAIFSFVPGPGTHFLRYQGTWIKMNRERNGKLLDITTGSPWETLTLTTLYSSRSVFPRLLSEAEGLVSAKSEGKTTIYTAWGLEWRAFGNARKTRQLDSVVLKRGQRERIVSDISAFLSRGQWYARRGIPYRRGYLLHGSPGSGKTSMVQALAGEMDLNICLLNLSERGLTDDRLTHLLSMAPERSILLLEDIDAAFPSRLAADAQKFDAQASATSSSSRQVPPTREYQTSVTFSGLLNALDGVASGESRIVVMTTNHVERLDTALIRPGRVDLIEELGDADEDMARGLFERFYSASAGSFEKSVRNPEGQPTSNTWPSSAELSAAASGNLFPSVAVGDNILNDPRSSEDAATDPFAVPVLPPKVYTALADRLAHAVTNVSMLRRRELGLEDSGRFVQHRPKSDGIACKRTSNNRGSGGKIRKSGDNLSDPAAPSADTAAASPGLEARAGQRTKAKTLPAARGGVSMAELQGLFIRYPLDPMGAVKEMENEAQADQSCQRGRSASSTGFGESTA